MVGHRYYSSELCRFVQPSDVSTLNPSSVNGLNLYSNVNNNPIGITYCNSIVGGLTSGEMVSSLTLGKIIITNLGMEKNNNSGIQWKNELLVTDLPNFLFLTKYGFEVVNWSISLYKGILYLNEAKTHYIYVYIYQEVILLHMPE